MLAINGGAYLASWLFRRKAETGGEADAAVAAEPSTEAPGDLERDQQRNPNGLKVFRPEFKPEDL